MNTTTSPWGLVERKCTIAPGIVSVSTASHGGILITAERFEAMPTYLRDLRPFAGPYAYEEDCDWAIVAAAFPKLFPADEVRAAVLSLRGWQLREKPEALALLNNSEAARIAGVK